MFINITIILHENRAHVPAVSTKYSHLAATPGAAYPPRLRLAYLGQYLGHILSKVYDISKVAPPGTPAWPASCQRQNGTGQSRVSIVN